MFDLDRIQKLAGDRVLARASMIPASDIEDLTEVDDHLSAVARGTMPYTVATGSRAPRSPGSRARVPTARTASPASTLPPSR
ncbi:MAG: hypothetical protein M5U19_18215 [Microthrixaceae bacterium]|nr:hypothetical protein [Microthrixaceae bacterium]